MEKKSILTKFAEKLLSNQKVSESVTASWQAHMASIESGARVCMGNSVCTSGRFCKISRQFV